MKKRVFAWVLLVCFIALLLNIVVFKFYWELSVVVYLFIIFTFLLLNKKP
jgi:hypothetical protein